MQWSGGHRATVSRRHSSLWSFLCGELYVQLSWFIVHQKYGVDSRVFRPELQLHCLERKLQCNFLACYVLNPWSQCQTLRLCCCSQVKTHVMPTRHKDRISMFHSHCICTECNKRNMEPMSIDMTRWVLNTSCPHSHRAMAWNWCRGNL